MHLSSLATSGHPRRHVIEFYHRRWVFSVLVSSGMLAHDGPADQLPNDAAVPSLP